MTQRGTASPSPAPARPARPRHRPASSQKRDGLQGKEGLVAKQKATEGKPRRDRDKGTRSNGDLPHTPAMLRARASGFHFPPADSLPIKQELKNYSNRAPFKHKPQGPLLIVQFLSQSQPAYNKAALPAALAYRRTPRRSRPGALPTGPQPAEPLRRAAGRPGLAPCGHLPRGSYKTSSNSLHIQTSTDLDLQLPPQATTIQYSFHKHQKQGRNGAFRA